jgi:hypothetical protein
MSDLLTPIPIAANQPTVDLLTAARAWGITSNTTAYRMASNNEFPFPVHRVGGKWRVPTAALRRALCLPEND